jgi:hypothetical protein
MGIPARPAHRNALRQPKRSPARPPKIYPRALPTGVAIEKTARARPWARAGKDSATKDGERVTKDDSPIPTAERARNRDPKPRAAPVRSVAPLQARTPADIQGTRRVRSAAQATTGAAAR